MLGCQSTGRRSGEASPCQQIQPGIVSSSLLDRDLDSVTVGVSMYQRGKKVLGLNSLVVSAETK